MNENEEKKIKFCLTVKKYKLLHKIIACVRDEIAINFGQRGILIATPSVCNTQYLSIKMPKAAFESYQVDKNDKIGFDLIEIAQRGVTTKGSHGDVSFDIQNSRGDTNEMKHSCVLHHSGMFNDCMVLPSVSSIYSGYKKPRPVEPECVFQMTAGELQKICEHCEQMLVAYDGKAVVFGNYYEDVNEWTTDGIPADTKGKGSAIYSSENILPFVKELPAKLVLNIGFTDDYPMRIQAEFIEKCMAELLVAPRIES